MNYRKLNLDEVKQIQMTILDEIVEFCKSNSIQYFLFAGTLLGAVRHKGYIPWDDDIDLCMLREDYEKFTKSYKGNTTYLLNYTNSNEYYYPIAKVCKKGTIAKENAFYAKQLGINIDIFPIDNIPDSVYECKKFFKCIEKYRKMLARKVNFQNKSVGKIKKILQKVYGVMTFYKSKLDILNDINKNTQEYNNKQTKRKCSVVWGIGIEEAVDADVFSDVVEVEFEGKKYFAPIGYNVWLKQRYGNYMELPPEDKRISHHDREDFIKE